MGWHVRRGIAGDLGNDVAWFAAWLIVAGGVVAIVAREVTDFVLHHHSAKTRQAAGRVSHRH